jgi:predicted nucleotidyltransferase
MNHLEEAILKTLCYRDLFDYPLTEGEIAEFLVEESAHSSEVGRVLAQLVAEGKIGQSQGFYYLSGREKIAAVRRQRELISERKYARARKLAQILRRFPWVRAVFITGALAAGNAEKEADLDFLVVTRRNRVWLARLGVYLLFSVLGWKRPRGVEEAPDRVCLNMFLAEDELAVPDEEQNLFTAHEVALARPLWARDFLHQRFLGENPWVKNFLPNLDLPEVKIPASKSFGRPVATVIRRLLDFLDWLSHQFQLLYMRGRRTREVVERNRILFHPINLSREILAAYRVKLYAQLHRNPTYGQED